MKILLVLVFLTVLGLDTIYAQRVESSCTVSDSVLNFYREDAAKMAFFFQLKRDSSYIDSTTILQSLQDTFLNALAAVYNAKLQAVDTVLGRVLLFSSYYGWYGVPIPVHHDGYKHFHDFFITLDTTIGWQKNLADSIIPTGNSKVDNFLQTFGLTISEKSSSTIRLKTNNYYNPIAMVRKWNILLDSMPTAYSSFQPREFAGSAIIPTFTDTALVLEYEYAWGDCPAGCINGRAWIFTVYPDCSVAYNYSYGSNLFLNRSVNTGSQDDEFTIYPNPASNTIIIETEPSAEIALISTDGNIIQQFHSNAKRFECSVASLSNGTYFVRITNHDGSIHNGKFIKK